MNLKAHLFVIDLRTQGNSNHNYVAERFCGYLAGLTLISLSHSKCEESINKIKRKKIRHNEIQLSLTLFRGWGKNPCKQFVGFLLELKTQN